MKRPFRLTVMSSNKALLKVWSLEAHLYIIAHTKQKILNTCQGSSSLHGWFWCCFSKNPYISEVKLKNYNDRIGGPSKSAWDSLFEKLCPLTCLLRLFWGRRRSRDDPEFGRVSNQRRGEEDLGRGRRNHSSKHKLNLFNNRQTEKIHYSIKGLLFNKFKQQEHII